MNLDCSYGKKWKKIPLRIKQCGGYLTNGGKYLSKLLTSVYYCVKIIKMNLRERKMTNYINNMLLLIITLFVHRVKLLMI